MSFQGYLDNIKVKTGKTPDDFKKLAEKKGLLADGVKAGDIVKWLKEDFELGHGHAMAIYATFKGMKEPDNNGDKLLDKHFDGNKSVWRKPYDGLLAKMRKFGKDFSVAPTNTYISLLRGDKKFGVLQFTGERMDVGLKLKEVLTTERLEASGNWNSLVTHRVRVTEGKQIDKELLGWLQQAYEQNVKKK